MASPAKIRSRLRPATRIAASRNAAKPKLANLFDQWEEISQRVRTAKTIRLFLDFDGTLVPYRPMPNQVRLGVQTRDALRKLSRHSRVHAAVVSGRRRAELAHFIKVPGLEFLGLYGWENGSGAVELPARTEAKLSHARTILAALQLRLPDIWVEEKGISLAVHFRGASQKSQRLAEAFLRRTVPRFGPEIHAMRGRDVWEIVPTQVRGKGAALRAIVKRIREPFLPIYIGDDLTDEPAFGLLRRGITVLVGPIRRTKAEYHLPHPTDVGVFLKMLAQEISRPVLTKRSGAYDTSASSPGQL